MLSEKGREKHGLLTVNAVNKVSTVSSPFTHISKEHILGRIQGCVYTAFVSLRASIILNSLV